MNRSRSPFDHARSLASLLWLTAVAPLGCSFSTSTEAQIRGGTIDTDSGVPTVDVIPDPTFSTVQPAIITGAGPGGGPHIRQWRIPSNIGFGFFYRSDISFVLEREFFAFDPAFRGGVFVG